MKLNPSQCDQMESIYLILRKIDGLHELHLKDIRRELLKVVLRELDGGRISRDGHRHSSSGLC